jgi:hypothetical protein|nr:MAG TPA: hypothetical protein [Caudoviricetes sp.]
MDWQELKKINENLKGVDVKGKKYIEVNKRVMGFRELEPNGSIVTEIVDIQNGIVVMKTTVCNGDGQVLGTGFAYEKESSSYINKTSYIENCETSAVGRALGFCGIGVDSSIASAEEVTNAIHQQEIIKEGEKLATAVEKKTFLELCKKFEVDYKKILAEVGCKGQMTKEQHGKAMIILKDIENARATEQ